MRYILSILTTIIIAITSSHAQSCSQSFIDRIKCATNKAALIATAEQAEEYLYSIGSSGYNEELFISVLNAMLQSPLLSDTEKIRPSMLLESASKNRVDSIAANIAYVTPDGKNHMLHDNEGKYTILFFNDPDCSDCADVKQQLAQSTIISHTHSNNLLRIVGIYTYSNEALWKAGNYPEIIVNGWDKECAVECGEEYVLRQIPTLYLLDQNNRVILKDSSLTEILDYLKPLNNSATENP